MEVNYGDGLKNWRENLSCLKRDSSHHATVAHAVFGADGGNKGQTEADDPSCAVVIDLVSSPEGPIEWTCGATSWRVCHQGCDDARRPTGREALPSAYHVSPTLVIDTSMERSSRVLQHGKPKIWIYFSKKFEIEFWLVLKSWKNLSFVNISSTVVTNTCISTVTLRRWKNCCRDGNATGKRLHGWSVVTQWRDGWMEWLFFTVTLLITVEND